MTKLRDYDAAAKEAFEEAGLVGNVSRRSIGAFLYWKRMRKTFRLIEVDLYPLKVTKQFKKWPEKSSRKIAWLTADDAILLLDEPRLKALIGAFAGEQDSVQDSLES